jgi:hypothetical protein
LAGGEQRVSTTRLYVFGNRLGRFRPGAYVRTHPEWFVWVKRPVLLEDLDRLERLEGSDAAA